MWDQKTYDNFIAALEDNNPMKIATWLSHIDEEPCGNPAIIPHLEKLLEDKRITTLRTPLAYGELRWNAALALIMERQVQQIGEPVQIIRQTFAPMRIPDLLFLISDSEFTLPGGDDWLRRLRGIHEAGNLALADFEFRFGQEPKKLKS